MGLPTLGTEAGHLKAGFLGFQGSGKTHTAFELAFGVRGHFKLDGPIAMIDTERGSDYWAKRVKARTGKPLAGKKTRALSDAVDFIKECIREKVSVLIIDSATHLWKELTDSYLDQKNKVRLDQGRTGIISDLTFRDWKPIKAKWNTFADLYLNSPLHMIVCGRAGWDWDFEDVDDSGKKQLIKKGVKMKAEGEFGFESSLLIEMKLLQTNPESDQEKHIKHRAIVLKDRYDVMDGAFEDNPAFPFFLPYVKQLDPSAYAPVDTTTQTDFKFDQDGNAEWRREKLQREKAAEEIQGLLTVAFPGQSAVDKKAKAEIIHSAFGTYSWTSIENTKSEELLGGLARLPDIIQKYRDNQEPKEKPKKPAKTPKPAKPTKQEAP